MSIQTTAIANTAKKVTNGVLSIKVAGKWDVDEFNALMTGLNILYFVASSMNQKEEIPFDRREYYLDSFGVAGFQLDITNRIPDFTFRDIDVSKNSLRPSERAKEIDGFKPLQIHELKFSSKGSFDFIGMGNAVKEVSNIIAQYLPSKPQETAVKLDKRRRQIEKIQILKQLNVREERIKKMLLLEDRSMSNILHFIDKKMITAVGYELNNSQV